MVGFPEGEHVIEEEYLLDGSHLWHICRLMERPRQRENCAGREVEPTLSKIQGTNGWSGLRQEYRYLNYCKTRACYSNEYRSDRLVDLKLENWEFFYEIDIARFKSHQNCEDFLQYIQMNGMRSNEGFFDLLITHLILDNQLWSSYNLVSRKVFSHSSSLTR